MSGLRSKPTSRVLLCLGLGLITLALYLPSLRHEFVDYDDQQYVTDNPRVKAGLSTEGFIWAFGYHAGNWHPLTWLSHMLDCELYKLNAGGHHLTNALLHTANSVLLLLVLSSMTQSLWRSAAVAALFAWHPLHVESVAWVAERKDVLCAFFWLLTMAAYGKYATASSPSGSAAQIQARKKAAGWYGMTLLAFTLALMSKPMAVTLPFALLLLDYWPLRRLRFTSSDFKARTALGLLAEKLPFLLLSLGASLLTLSAQKLAIVSTKGLPVAERIAHACEAYVHYLGAMILPRGLAVYYPYETGRSLTEVIVAVLILAGITTLTLFELRRRPYLATAWLWYLGTLVPVIGLVQVGDQAWADRYTYLPSIGVFIGLVWLAAELLPQKRPMATLAGTVAVTLLVLTSMQLRHWQNSRTLFTRADQVTRNNHLAATLLGSLLAKDGKLDEAMVYYQRALSYRSNYAEIHFFLGHALDQKGKLDEAIGEYRRALASGQMREQTYIFLGVALTKQHKFDEAVASYQAALKINPESAVAHNNLARLSHSQGRLDDATEHYHAALKSDPDFAPAHNNFGVLLLQQGQAAEGAGQLRTALRLNPDDQEAQFNLALALNQLGQWTEAAEWFGKTVRRETIDPNAHFQYARALDQLGKTREAMSWYAGALLLQPDFPAALDGLAWILATSSDPEFRNGPEAVRMAERAVELTGRKDAAKHRTLAAAYAEAGQFSLAISNAQTALDLSIGGGNQDLANKCRQALDIFKASQPLREE